MYILMISLLFKFQKRSLLITVLRTCSTDKAYPVGIFILLLLLLLLLERSFRMFESKQSDPVESIP